MPQPPSSSQETSVDIFALSPNSIKALGQENLSQAFFEGTSSIILRAQEMGLVDEGRMSLPSFLDVIDERLHGGDDIPDPDLSKKLDAIFHLTSLSVVRKQVPYEEIEVTVTDDEIEYHNLDEPDPGDGSLWQRFLTERAQKRAQEEAERAAWPQRRQQARKQSLEKRAQAQTEEAARLGQLYRDAIKKRNKSLDRKRQRRLKEQRTEWSTRTFEIAESLPDSQREVLPILHLPGAEAGAVLGIKVSTLVQRVFYAKQKIGADTREALAIWALEHGIDYEVAKPPPMENFTLRERTIAHNLDKENPDIVNELVLSPKRVASGVISLLRKTGARNRTELALIARIHGFLPLDEEVSAAKAVEALEPFTEYQRPVLSRLHLPYETISGELGIAEYSVQGAVRRALLRSGLSSRTELATKLHEDGMQFDIRQPKRPLHELLTRDELDICMSLHIPYQEIADRHDLPVERVNALVGYMKAKTGARTRVELALMARVFDNGQAKEPYHNVRPRGERFFEALGIDPVPMEEARTWLRYATPRQAEYIEAYYFSPEQLSWRGIGEQFIVHKITAMSAAIRGVERIREQLIAAQDVTKRADEATQS